MKNKTMKGIFLTSLFLLTLSLAFVSCKKDDNNISEETISAKWVVSDPATTGYRYFEFNKYGSYIVTKSDYSVKFGAYTLADQKINLVDLGTIEAKTLADDSFKFDFTPTGASAPISIETTKAEQMATTTRTEDLCRTWTLVSIDNVPVAGTDNELTVLFSESGTYLVSYSNGTSGTAQWKWKDSNEDTICYSWSGDPTCTADNQVAITSLSETEFIMTEEEVVYVLAPYTAKNGPALNPTNTVLKPNNFFGK